MGGLGWGTSQWNQWVLVWSSPHWAALDSVKLKAEKVNSCKDCVEFPDQRHTFLTVLSGSKAMSGTFASTIREKRFKIKLACLNMEWEDKDNEYVKQSLACIADGSFFCSSQSMSYSRAKAEPRSKTACNQSLEIFEMPLPVL